MGKQTPGQRIVASLGCDRYDLPEDLAAQIDAAIKKAVAAKGATLARRLAAMERVVVAARAVREDLGRQFCEQGDELECICDPGFDPCPRCRMFALLDRSLAALDEGRE